MASTLSLTEYKEPNNAKQGFIAVGFYFCCIIFLAKAGPKREAIPPSL